MGKAALGFVLAGFFFFLSACAATEAEVFIGVVPDGDRLVPGLIEPTLAPNPTAPANEEGQSLGWTTAPLLADVKVALNRDSILLALPVVAGAQEYRAFRIPAGVNVTGDS